MSEQRLSQEDIDDFCRKIEEDDIEAVRALLECHGKDIVHHKNSRSWYPLSISAWKGHAEIVALLLQKGARIDEAHDGMWTALTRAAYKGHTETVALLLEGGANYDYRDASGQTAQEWAEKENQKDTADLLRAWRKNGEERKAEQERAAELVEIRDKIHGGLKEPVPYHGPLKFPKPKFPR